MTTHKNLTTTASDRQRDTRLAWRALGVAAAAENFGSVAYWLRRLQDLATPQAPPKPRAARELVFVDREGASCCACSRPIRAGGEAQRVLGIGLAHPACVENGMGGPHGT